MIIDRWIPFIKRQRRDANDHPFKRRNYRITGEIGLNARIRARVRAKLERAFRKLKKEKERGEKGKQKK